MLLVSSQSFHFISLLAMWFIPSVSLSSFSSSFSFHIFVSLPVDTLTVHYSPSHLPSPISFLYEMNVEWTTIITKIPLKCICLQHKTKPDKELYPDSINIVFVCSSLYAADIIINSDPSSSWVKSPSDGCTFNGRTSATLSIVALVGGSLVRLLKCPSPTCCMPLMTELSEFWQISTASSLPHYYPPIRIN